MTILPWILFAAALMLVFAFQRLNHRKRNQLENYIVFLLLSDDLRNDHKVDFQRWIVAKEAPNALQLTLAAHRVLDNMAEQFAMGDPANPATSSTLGAHSLLWNVKQRTEAS